MSNFPFNPNIPASADNPSNDQPLMLTNNTSTNGLIAVDHVGFNSTNNLGGCHNFVHLVAQGSAPPALGFTGILYTQIINDGFSSSESLFWLNGAFQTSRLTANVVPKVSGGPGAPGYTFLPGNATNPLVMQWGQVGLAAVSGKQTGMVTYTTGGNNIAFPNKTLNVICTVTSNGTESNSSGVDVFNVSKTGFSWVVSNAGSQLTGFFWNAIGY